MCGNEGKTCLVKQQGESKMQDERDDIKAIKVIDCVKNECRPAPTEDPKLSQAKPNPKRGVKPSRSEPIEASYLKDLISKEEIEVVVR